MADYMQAARRALMNEPLPRLDPQDVVKVRALLTERAPDLIGAVLGDADVD
jgi:hypothetical protein